MEDSCGIPADVLRRLHATLLKCSEFNSNDALMNVFVDARVANWKSRIYDGATSLDERVNSVIGALWSERSIQGDSALCLFLAVLRDSRGLGDALHTELSELINQLDRNKTEKPKTMLEDVESTNNLAGLPSLAIMMDRKEIIQYFRKSLGDFTRPYVIIVRGGDMMGKTYLLSYLHKITKNAVGLNTCALCAIKSGMSYTGVLDEIVHQLKFTFENYQYQRDRIARYSLRNIIQDLLSNVSDLKDLAGSVKQKRRDDKSRLLEGFINDLIRESSQCQIVILLDEVEQIGRDEESFIYDQLIPELVQLRNISIVLASKQKHAPSRIWDTCIFNLSEIVRSDYEEYLRDRRLSFSEEAIKILYETSGGNPGHLASLTELYMNNSKRNSNRYDGDIHHIYSL